MPSVCVVPVYVEVPDGFERAIATLEGILERSGYRFHTGTPFAGTLDEARPTLEETGRIRAGADTTCDELSAPPRHRIFLG